MQVLQLASKKQETVDPNLRASPRTLLYPDGFPVKNLPGGDEPFTVGGYQKFLRSPFDRLALYICPCADYGSE